MSSIISLILKEIVRIRGMVQYLILYVLRDGPLHGYGIMKKVSELFGLGYTPSSGVLYPALKSLMEEGLVEARVEGRRKIYQITEKGLRVLEEKRAEIEYFINRVRRATITAHKLGLDTLYELLRELWDHNIVVPEEYIPRIREHVQALTEIVMEIIEQAKNREEKPEKPAPTG